MSERAYHIAKHVIRWSQTAPEDEIKYLLDKEKKAIYLAEEYIKLYESVNGKDAD